MHDRWIPLIISNCGVVHPIKEALTSYRLHGNNCEGVKSSKMVTLCIFVIQYWIIRETLGIYF